MKQINTEIAVIGGGAAGLVAAAEAARTGARVLILEKLPRVGKKLLLTGNGRCNLGNRDRSMKNWHGSLAQCEKILSAFGAAEDFFKARGLFCRADNEGRLYPISNTAASVLDALRFDAAAYGVEIRCDCPVTAISAERGGFLLDTPQGAVYAKKVIFAVGGAAAPSCGTDGSGFRLIEKWHTPSVLQPALAPIRTDAKMVSALKGMRLSASVSLDAGTKHIADSVGEVQFTDGALSGICVFNLARYVDSNQRQTLSLRLLPEWEDDSVRKSIKTLFAQRSLLPAEDLLTGLVPKRVGQVILKSCGIAPSVPAGQIPREARTLLSERFLCWSFPVRGVAQFQNAQVTAGGIRGEEVDESLMSKRCKGLYFAGECLDVDGDCGGFNLQWAWASAVCAGRAAAKDLSRTGERYDSDSKCTGTAFV